MIRAIIMDVGIIVDRLTQAHTFDTIAPHLDAEVKYCLHNAFLDNRIYDSEVKITKGIDRIHLKIKIREDLVDHWDHLGFVIDKADMDDRKALNAYNRAMKGI